MLLEQKVLTTWQRGNKKNIYQKDIIILILVMNY